MLGPNACGFSKMSDQTPLGSVSWACYLSGLSVCGSGRIIDATPLGSATY